MLKQFFATKILKAEKVRKADIISKLETQLGTRTFDSMVRRLVAFEKSRKEECSGAYTIFAIGLGDSGVIPKVDYDYLWEKAAKVYGETDMVKRCLGTLLMYAFCLSDRKWLFIQDPEKAKKLREGDIPEATQYFLDTTGKGYECIDKVETSIDDLVSKFNKNKPTPKKKK